MAAASRRRAPDASPAGVRVARFVRRRDALGPQGSLFSELARFVAVNDFGACDVTVARVDFCARPASIAASYDAVIAADCVYSPETATALVATVRTARRRSPAAWRWWSAPRPACASAKTASVARVRRRAPRTASRSRRPGFDGHVELVTPPSYDAVLPLAAGGGAGVRADGHERW